MILQDRCTILYILKREHAATGEDASMVSTIERQVEREAQRVQAGSDELVERVTRAIRQDEYAPLHATASSSS
jgi:hemerythrin-like domain-containing protein